jgi:hypothetical protein
MVKVNQPCAAIMGEMIFEIEVGHNAQIIFCSKSSVLDGELTFLRPLIKVGCLYQD